MFGGSTPAPEYVAARRVLLDALGALGPHRAAVVLVGAQALYLRVGTGSVAVAPYTTDADVAMDPRLIGDAPLLADALGDAGFTLAVRPGTWIRDGVAVDLLVPASLGGAGRRAARLGPHGNDIARTTTGLETALVDNNAETIIALDPADKRTQLVRVANLASLLVAKLHKISDRAGDPSRRIDKDALDVLRLFQGAEPQGLGTRLTELTVDPLAGTSVRASRAMLATLFGTVESVGTRMAVRATEGIENPQVIGMSCVILAAEVLDHWAM